MADRDPDIEPRLPQELERAIFEIATYDRRRDIPKLIQVARRVRTWLEPILYEVCLLCPLAGIEDAQNLDIQFYQKFCLNSFPPYKAIRIQHLLFNSIRSEFTWAEHLPHCHNLQSVSVWADPSHPGNALETLTSTIQSPMRTISPRGLLQLSARLSQIFPNEYVNFNHAILKDITHLDVIDDESELSTSWTKANNLGCLKNLRYLSFFRWSSAKGDILKECLEVCESLELLVIFNRDEGLEQVLMNSLPKVRRTMNEDRIAQDKPEDRVVLLPTPPEGWVEDWYKGVTEGENYWAVGERIVEERRQLRVIT